MLQIRIMLRKNQAEMGNLVGTTEGGWNNYERGTRPITLAAARALYREIGLSLDWIFEADAGNLSEPLRHDLARAKTEILGQLDKPVRTRRAAG